LAFPRENEEQIRRVVLDICQDHVRKVLDAVRELSIMISDFASGSNMDSMDKHLAQIKKLKEEATEQKRVLLNELAETGMLLINREDFLRLIIQIDEIVDFCEGAGYRVSTLTEKKMKVKKEITESLANLSKNVLKTMTNLRETILSLTYSRTKALEMAKSVEVAEYAVDEIFRDTEMKILDAKLEIGPTILLRDLAQLLEDIADKAEDAIDSTRVLALGV
jgi:predicted phosphate transport protein (TIGR00153 family)